jgi:uncharacterized protein (TIGR00255 family)
MTGYGEAVGRTSGGVLRVELRTVNHRYLNVNSRLPSSLGRWETEIRDWLRGLVSRGQVTCTARWETDTESAAPTYRLDDQRVAGYLRVFGELSDRFGVEGRPDLALLARFSDILVRDVEETVQEEVTGDDLRPIVEEAARQAVRMREEEGRRLQADLEERVVGIERALARIAQLAPERLDAERKRLRAAVAELVGETAVDENRVAHEIAILAERWDINEELVRFRSHNDLFRELLAADSAEPVGKRLAFLAQEMHREANTIGSKANDAAIAHLVVAIKDELERLREQVENVE